jgi:histidine triad (HIT) family protein
MSPGADDGCIFCRIVSKQVPSKEAYAGELVYAFHDLHPIAPVHVIVVTRHHITTSGTELGPEHGPMLVEMWRVARRVAEQFGLADAGYRLAVNVGRDAGAEVAHLHMHVFGGRRLAWPPG